MVRYAGHPGVTGARTPAGPRPDGRAGPVGRVHRGRDKDEVPDMTRGRCQRLGGVDDLPLRG